MKESSPADAGAAVPHDPGAPRWPTEPAAGDASSAGPDSGQPANTSEFGSPDSTATDTDDSPLDVESLVASLEAVSAERDAYLADVQRVTAEFANFRRQATKRQSETVEHAASGLAEKLLPILDACDAALTQGAVDVEPIQVALIEVWRKEGLELVAESGSAFDPERHEAVMHEQGDGLEPVVAEVMRAGYVWNGRVLRPAMVRVKG